MAVGRVFKKVRKGVEDKNWSYRWYVRGQEFERSSRSVSKTIAEKLLRKAIEKSGAGVLPAEDRVRYEDLMLKVENRRIEDRKSLNDVAQRRRHLDAFFGGMRAIDIRTETVDRYVALRLKEQAKPATINQELSLLRRGFNLAELSLKPQIKLLNVSDNVRRDFLDWGDFCAVREHLPEWMADFCTVAFLTSWRQGQLAALEWRDVDMNARTMTARQETTKGGVPHCIPLVGEVWEILERAHAHRRLDCANAFHRDGNPILLRGSKSPARKAWGAATKAAGFPAHYLHGLRRSGIRFMVQTGGIDAHTAMGFSGHKTRSVFDRYDIQSVDGMRRAMEAATAKLPEQPASKVRKIG